MKPGSEWNVPFRKVFHLRLGVSPHFIATLFLLRSNGHEADKWLPPMLGSVGATSLPLLNIYISNDEIMRTFVGVFSLLPFLKNSANRYIWLCLSFGKYHPLPYHARIKLEREEVNELVWWGKEVQYFLNFLAGPEEKKVRNHSWSSLFVLCFWVVWWKQKKTLSIPFPFTPQTCQGVMEGTPWETKDPQWASSCAGDGQGEESSL